MLNLHRLVVVENAPAIASILNAKGLMLRSLGDCRSAELCYREALTIQQHALGERDVATLLTMHNLGKLLHGMGQYKDAQSLLGERQALQPRVIEQ
jgi:Flp pilus assembly protein TadD